MRLGCESRVRRRSLSLHGLQRPLRARLQRIHSRLGLPELDVLRRVLRGSALRLRVVQLERAQRNVLRAIKLNVPTLGLKQP